MGNGRGQGLRQAIANGNLVRKLRERMGLSQAEFCRRAQMGMKTLERVESGSIAGAPVSYETIRKAARVLGVDQLSIRDWDQEQEWLEWERQQEPPPDARVWRILGSRRFARVDEARVKVLREGLGLTPEELAKAAHVAPITVRRIEKQVGWGLTYRLDVIEKLSEALGEDITDREGMDMIARDADGVPLTDEELPGRVEVFGSAVRVARLRAHFSLGELARQSGVALATVTRLENKGFPPPYTTRTNRRIIARLAAALGVDAVRLCRGKEATDDAETLRAGFGELVK